MAQFVKIAASARRHGVSRVRILTAMRHAPAPEALDGSRVRFIGRDSRGAWLLVLAREGREGGNSLIVYHATPWHWHRQGR